MDNPLLAVAVNCAAAAAAAAAATQHEQLAGCVDEPTITTL